MVLDFTVTEGWMRFDSLDRLRSGTPAHVLAWRFKDDRGEAWTSRLNAFKEKQELTALKGAARVLAEAIPALLAANHWQPTQTAMTAALSSDDTRSVPTKPLPRVGRAVAERLGIQWLPDILSKNAHRKLHNISSASDRDAEAAKACYRCAPVTGVRRILLLDDLITRGTTLDNICQAVAEQNREVRAYPLALGKTEKKSYAASLGRDLSNEHVPARWAARWDTG